MTEFDECYKLLLKDILENGVEELNERTGHRTKSLPGLHFAFSRGFPLLTLRSIPVRAFVAEQIWFLMGSRKPAEFLSRHAKIWNEFINIGGVVSTAYGYRWRCHFGRDQIASLINLLEKEPSSRQGVVITWDPSDDGLNPDRTKKNVPCPFSFVVNIIGGKLHLHNLVRSNDMILGFPYDVAGFALLQRILAARLGVRVGTYSHSISNAHIYDVHYDAAIELLTRMGQANTIDLTAHEDWFARAESGDESLVDEIVDLLHKQYTPNPAIRGLPIVV